MVKVAVVGSGNLGTSIAHSIHQNKQHSVVVLSRKPRPDLTQLGLPVTLIDYSKPETLVSALEGVHTVISVVFSFDPASFISSQLALLEAAKKAGVKRFAPSEWAFSEAADHEIGIYNPKAEIWKSVKESGLQYTAFRPGLYLNFLATGSPKPDVDEKVFKAAPKLTVGLDIAKGKAEIPGTGEEKFNITTTDDIAGFVAASLDTKWTEKSGGMAGSVVTFNQLVKVAEEITGKKFDVTYHSTEELEKKAKEDPSQAVMLSFHIALAKGMAYIEPTLNKTTDYKPVTAEDFIRQWWA